MGCVISTQKLASNQLKTKTICNFKTYLSQLQINLLKLIFKDLAWRIADHKLNVQNFKLFFHKKGLWGQKLFKEFLRQQQDYIDQQTFLSGMGFIFKSSHEERIKVLFKFFTNSDNYQEGITFQQFVIMLYNYPTQQVKELLNDKDFFNQELKHHIMVVGKTKTNNEAANTLENEFILCKVTNENSQFTPSTTIVRSESKQRANTFFINFQNQHYQIKLSNIQNLLKKYAKCIFHKFHVEISTGKLNYESFRAWVEGHQKFYSNYFQGVHNEIWQVDDITNKLKLQKVKSYLQAECKINQADTYQNKKVYIKLIHSCLIIFKNKVDKIPLEIICLDGLQVKNSYQEEYGFGLEIYHRDNVYQNKKLYFQNEDLQNIWLDALRCYQGQRIQEIYRLGDKIGKGAFGVVYKCVDQPYAIKDIQKYKYLSLQDKQFIQHESDIMKQLNSPFVIKYIQTIKTKFEYYIITQLVQGKSLLQYIHKFHYLTQKQAIPIAYQLVLGVKYLHNNGIVHRDLKPQNIMINMDQQGNLKGKIKIIDLGLAEYIYLLHQMQNKGHAVAAGTPGFIAPELIQNKKFDEKIDNFSIGVIIFFMIYGKRPFDGFDQAQIYQNTLNGAYQFKNNPKNPISQKCKGLIRNLLQVNPQNRISLDDAIRHQWFDAYRPHHQ